MWCRPRRPSRQRTDGGTLPRPSRQRLRILGLPRHRRDLVVGLSQPRRFPAGPSGGGDANGRLLHVHPFPQWPGGDGRAGLHGISPAVGPASCRPGVGLGRPVRQRRGPGPGPHPGSHLGAAGVGPHRVLAGLGDHQSPRLGRWTLGGRLRGGGGTLHRVQPRLAGHGATDVPPGLVRPSQVLAPGGRQPARGGEPTRRAVRVAGHSGAQMGLGGVAAVAVDAGRPGVSWPVGCVNVDPGSDRGGLGNGQRWSGGGGGLPGEGSRAGKVDPPHVRRPAPLCRGGGPVQPGAFEGAGPPAPDGCLRRRCRHRPLRGLPPTDGGTPRVRKDRCSSWVAASGNHRSDGRSGRSSSWPPAWC